MKQDDKGPVIIIPPGSSTPIPIGKDTNITKLAESQLETVARDLYTGDDKRFKGLSRLEAALLSLGEDAPHDADARKEFLDRILGKPKQRIDSTHVSLDLTSFLSNLVAEENAVEVEVTPDETEGNGDPVTLT